MGCALFQFAFTMKFIYYLQSLYGTGVRTGKLSFVDYADLIACDHTIFTFQSGTRKIEYIGSFSFIQN